MAGCGKQDKLRRYGYFGATASAVLGALECEGLFSDTSYYGARTVRAGVISDVVIFEGGEESDHFLGDSGDLGSDRPPSGEIRPHIRYLGIVYGSKRREGTRCRGPYQIPDVLQSKRGEGQRNEFMFSYRLHRSAEEYALNTNKSLI